MRLQPISAIIPHERLNKSYRFRTLVPYAWMAFEALDLNRTSEQVILLNAGPSSRDHVTRIG